jgi:hypothetical protein
MQDPYAACAQKYPLWVTLTRTQQEHILRYDGAHTKRVRKGKLLEKRNIAIESLIDAIFNVNDGFIPNDIVLRTCASAPYNMVDVWTNFLAAARASPNGEAAMNALKCPVTRDWFAEPMLFPSGYSYEKNIINRLRNAQGQIVDPATRRVVADSDIEPNTPLHEVLAMFSILHQEDRADEFGGGKSRKITRRRRSHKMKRTTKRRYSSKKSSKKSKRF